MCPLIKFPSLGKEASMRDILNWLLTFLRGEVAHILDACGPLCEEENALKMTTTLISLFEELYIVHCGTKKWNKWLQQWTGQFDAHLETKIQVKILEEELRLEKDVWVSIALPASGLTDKVREQDAD